MFLKVINTGSQGNGYAIGNENEVLLIEAGCRFMDIKKALNFRVDNIVGMVISHEHGDHFKHHAEYSVAGIPLFMPFVRDGKYQQFGHFYIKAFELPHGDTKSYGFYIRHKEIGQLLFLTDFEFSPISFEHLNVEHIMIECNYQLDMVDVDAPNFRHKIQGHCADTTCLDFVKHNNSSRLRTVTILHVGSGTIDEDLLINRIQNIVDSDVSVEIAKSGLEIKLNKEVF